ncbi:type II/IV secretion system protein [Candidatus Falkowbacteria bacterium]|nr:type II/IV secretion system protein [Candidatus Falkowbacteria bacterium]
MLPFSNNQILKSLVQTKVIPETEAEKIKEEIKKTKKNIIAYLVEENIVTEKMVYNSIADNLKIPFIDLKNQIINPEILFTIPEPIAQSHEVIAFAKNSEEISLATLDTEDIQIFEFLERKTGLKTKIHLTYPESFKAGLKQYHKGLKATFKDITGPKTKKTEAKDKNLKKLAEDLPVIRIVDSVLEYAMFENASDIHIEPSEGEIVVRYRIDGILKDVMTLPKTVQSGIVARIKVLSDLKLDEHRLPQDGRFKVKNKENEVSFRVSILPVMDGEKVVMRLLWESGKILSLEDLGLQKYALETVKRNIKKPHGMLLVVGPTGSGKTTTLYTILNILNQPGINISTIEDPIEYRMERINQSQVNSKIGFTFSNGLRALLRQDPDMIMVGEIRDSETADIAVNAALTGHLVLSTLHTNNAIGTLPRLMEMGVPSFLVSSTTNIIIAQRLVRKICPNCIQSYNLSEKEIEELNKKFNMAEILKTMVNINTIKSKNILKDILFYKGKGCKQCNNDGYKGRIGVYEILEITPEISKLITKKVSDAEILAAARNQKMITVIEDGFIKAKNGTTSIEEVIRVTKE